INPFASVKAEEAGVLASKPTAPANSGTTAQPAAGGAPPPPGAGVPAPATPDQAATTPPSTEEPKPVEQPKPAEQPEPEEPQLTKPKMTPASLQAVIGKVGELQTCYQDAVVGKPDPAGQVVFTISLDQDGVVKKVEIAKDEVKYGVAKCSAKK